MDLKVTTSCFLTQRSQGARVLKEHRVYLDSNGCTIDFDSASKGSEIEFNFSTGRKRLCIVHFGNCHNTIVSENRLNSFLEVGWNKLQSLTRSAFKQGGETGFMRVTISRIDLVSALDCVKVS